MVLYLENKYIYRKHLREPWRVFLTLGLIVMITYIIIATGVTLTGEIEDKLLMGLIFLVIGIFLAVMLCVEFLILYFVAFRRFKKIHVILTEEALIYNNAKGETIIPYENVKALKFPSIKYLGGWIKIVHADGNVKLTVVLENIGDMVIGLKNKLDEKNLTKVYNDKKIYNFIKTAKYSDQSWERIYEYLKYFAIAISGITVIAMILSAFITEVPTKILALTASIAGPIVALIIPEIIFGIKLAKGSSKENFYVPNRDKKFEFKVYKWTLGIYVAIYLMVMFLV